MKTSRFISLLICLLSFILFFSPLAQAALVKGIYITQTTLEDKNYLSYLIKQAKETGITTFIVDLELPSKRYETNIQLLKENNIAYVARIIMFPGGGTPEVVDSEKYREKKYNLIKKAVSYGANQIQLDYIRYNTKQKPSTENAKNIYKIIQEIKQQLTADNVPLQVDVFGISSYGESKYIGQNIKLFSGAVDAVCPMVYPSHYEPFVYHANRPYETVYGSLKALKAQFDNKMPIKLYPFIELSNYRYPLSHDKKIAYIYAQIKAAEDAGADGWYVWSAQNKYDNLFYVLKTHKVQ